MWRLSGFRQREATDFLCRGSDTLYPLCFVFWNVSEVYTKGRAHTATSLFGSLERGTLWGRGMLTHPSSEFLNSAGCRTQHKLVGSWMCWCSKGSAFNVVTLIAGELLMCRQRAARICDVSVWRQTHRRFRPSDPAARTPRRQPLTSRSSGLPRWNTAWPCSVLTYLEFL